MYEPDDDLNDDKELVDVDLDELDGDDKDDDTEITDTMRTQRNNFFNKGGKEGKFANIVGNDEGDLDEKEKTAWRHDARWKIYE